jgi:hypothetical protein
LAVFLSCLFWGRAGVPILLEVLGIWAPRRDRSLKVLLDRLMRLLEKLGLGLMPRTSERGSSIRVGWPLLAVFLSCLFWRRAGVPIVLVLSILPIRKFELSSCIEQRGMVDSIGITASTKNCPCSGAIAPKTINKLRTEVA